MKTAMTAIIRKDFRGVAANKQLFTSLLVVPLVLTVLLPSIFMLAFAFAPEDPDVQKLLELLPPAARGESLELTVAGLLLNFILPVFFLIVPIMTASVMAASAFVGEKEKRTLETLLYCPLSVGQIFRAKVMASFLLSMLVSLISFCAMLAVVELEAFFLMGRFLTPGVTWLIVLLLVAPALSLIAVTLIVRGSAKARSVMESQQSAAFLILPLVLLVAGQFTGVLLLSPWVLMALGAVCALLAWLLLKKCVGRFTYETLLK